MSSETISSSSKKRKVTAAAAGTLAGAALLAGTLSYFTDRDSTNVEATAGTVDIGITADWQNVANFNPGDQADLGYTISSEGNKSVDVREKLVVKSSVAMADSGQAEFEIYRAADVAQDANGAYIPNPGAEPITTGADRVMSDDKMSITYSIDEYVLNGAGANAEVEAGISETSKESEYVLVFKNSSENAFQGAEASVDLVAEAKQHRNTGTDTWATVAKESIAVGGQNIDVVPER